MTIKKIIIIAAIALSMGLTNSRPAAARDHNTYKSLEKFADVINLLEKDYVEPINPDKLIQGAIKGMIASLDPHSSYMTAENFKDLQIETNGSFSGIGIEITIKNGGLVIVSPIEGTPAYQQGLKAGDRIIKINGIYTKDMDMMAAVKLLRGKRGTKVTISIYRRGWPKLRKFTITRDVIPLHSVKSKILEPGYAYLRITSFQAKTTKDTLRALKKLSKQGPLKGLILDLRNNPGGLLDQATGIADIFMDKGIIVSTKGRLADQNMVYRAHQGAVSYDFPIIVLINGGSASASEIVAGALQDSRRALILGVQSFGKGSVQTVFPLNNGAGLRLTTARYYTPSGRSIQAKGVTPDIIVPLLQDHANGGARTFIREKDLKHHMKNDNKTDRGSGTKSPVNARDNQLNAALKILEGLPVLKKPAI
ncbi:Carboxyl-terminal protease [hydrothermal vent metagenome]|uniref:Carboxyl-terminal protease n=1 Tax=hydrothermal vent metagenome TaxID=652676 RepID=A0A3B0VUJ2_9ZZZZ